MRTARKGTVKSAQATATIGLAFVLCAGSVMLGGCQSEPSLSSVAENDGQAQKPVVEIQRSPGKQSPPIDIAYKLMSVPKVGEPLDIDLTIGSSLAGEFVDLTLQAKGDLTMGANQQGVTRMSRSTATTANKADRSGSRDIERVTVIPQAEGRSYLSVMVSIPTAEGSVSKVISIPVQVGDLPPRLDINGTLSGSGEDTVVSMPAKESSE